MPSKKPLRVVAAYDTETTNLPGFRENVAFPILHQLGIFTGERLTDVTPGNVRDVVTVDMFRHAEEAYAAFETLEAWGEAAGVVPVVMVHNLGFDMYSLAPFLNSRECTVLARTSTKPINITVLGDEGAPALVFWDTLGMFAKSLETMGKECGMPKLTGAWDYERIRTPETPLTLDEIDYATEDIYTLFSYVGYYLRLNPLIDETELARRVSTKTGAVRVKRDVLFSKLKRHGTGKQAGRLWARHVKLEAPKDNDELYTMQACTRGGFTFTASRFASVPFEDLTSETVIAGFDASSQHPSQMTSHLFPEGFKKASAGVLNVDMELVKRVTMERLLGSWAKPFPVAFNTRIRITGLRLRSGSVWERDGIATLASARGSKGGKVDTWRGAAELLGKLYGAEEAELYLTELEWWLLNQVYEYDTAEALDGYETGRFTRPTDYSVLSVMYFFKAKNAFKRFMKTRVADDEVRGVAPAYLVEQMEDGTASEEEVKSYYQILKSDLNALYGIEITNEARAPQELQEGAGIVTLEASGVADMPKQPKTWYQFGQRIVGWSRIAQAVVIEESGKLGRIINGDTDSVKVKLASNNIETLQTALLPFSQAVEVARAQVCARVREQFPNYYDPLDGMGAYELEHVAGRFCAAWNKCYMLDACHGVEMVIAGVPTERGETSYTWAAEKLLAEGWSWSDVCSLLLGYNVTVGHGLTKLNGRAVPDFGARVKMDVVDYMGNVAHVDEPGGICLYREAKTLGGTGNRDNLRNMVNARRNNVNVNVAPVLLDAVDGQLIIEEIEDV